MVKNFPPDSRQVFWQQQEEPNLSHTSSHTTHPHTLTNRYTVDGDLKYFDCSSCDSTREKYVDCELLGHRGTQCQATCSYNIIQKHYTSEWCRTGKEGGGKGRRTRWRREGEKEKREVEEEKGREFFLTCIMNSILFPDSLPITHHTPTTFSRSACNFAHKFYVTFEDVPPRHKLRRRLHHQTTCNNISLVVYMCSCILWLL